MICIKPGVFSGKFKAPPSKPISQRYLLASALAEGRTTITGVEWSDDFTAMFRAVQPIATVTVDEDRVSISPKEPDPLRSINVMESGFTLRTAVAVYAGIPGLTAVIFGGTLRGRPIDELVAVLKTLTRVERGPGVVIIEGRRLEGFSAEVRANISSQYISGLMFLAAAVGNGSIRPLGERKSWHFVEATASVLKEFGASVELGEEIHVSGRLKSPGVMAVPGDFSLAAFLIAAAVATGGVAEIEGTLSDVDKAVLEIFREMGAEISHNGAVLKAGGSFSRPVHVDLSGNPDLVMPVALAAAFVEETSSISGVEHLRYKESDRVAAVLDVLHRLGVNAHYEGGTIFIRGPPTRRGVTLASHGDHRIGLMAMAVLWAVGGCIDDVAPVAKSWPSAVLHFLTPPQQEV